MKNQKTKKEKEKVNQAPPATKPDVPDAPAPEKSTAPDVQAQPETPPAEQSAASSQEGAGTPPAPEEPPQIAKITRLNRKKPFSTVVGADTTYYVQDGLRFAHTGELLP